MIVCRRRVGIAGLENAEGALRVPLVPQALGQQLAPLIGNSVLRYVGMPIRVQAVRVIAVFLERMREAGQVGENLDAGGQVVQ